MKLFITAASLLLAAASASGSDYYVSAAGNDNGSGSTSQPWRTISKVNSMRYLPGDKILFRGGDAFPGKIYFGPNAGGSASLPVTLSSYGVGKADIDAGQGDYAFVPAWELGAVIRRPFPTRA